MNLPEKAEKPCHKIFNFVFRDNYIYVHSGLGLGGTVITVAHTNTCAAIKNSKYNKLVAYDDEHYILNSSFRALFRGQRK